MKKTIIRLLILCLLIAMLLPIASAEKLSLNQVEQDVFVLTSFIEKEAYPDVVFNGPPSVYKASDLTYVRFPAPDGMVLEFRADVSSFYLEKYRVQLTYQLLNPYAFETFLNKAPDKNLILVNESDTAAYLDIRYLGNAYALLSIPQYGVDAKLQIRMTYHDFQNETITDKEIDIMKHDILLEIERIRENIQYVYGGPYWSEGLYEDIRVLSLHAPLAVKFHFEELPILGKDGQIEYSVPFLTNVDDTKYTMVASTASDLTEFEFDLKVGSPVKYYKDKDPDSVFTVVLDDGYEYEIWGHLYDTRYIGMRISRLLVDKVEYDQGLYLDWYVSNSEWQTKEDLIQLANALVACTTIETDLTLLGYVGVSEEPASPDEEPADEPYAPAESEANPDAWVCECSSVNTSNFCPECGTKRPNYNCEGCDYVFEKDSSFKFCPECGTKRASN
ncbi:MAG: zinc ribbon domain-containing protein [Clostridia bacterium]|nr:zinc ribbon domain-containing protein [Clostridia bacterium]